MCDITKPANPDNLSYMDKFGWLIICEDSGSPQKAADLLWAHNVSATRTRTVHQVMHGILPCYHVQQPAGTHHARCVLVITFTNQL